MSFYSDLWFFTRNLKDEKEFFLLQSFWILLRFSPFCEYFFLLFLLIDVREHLSIFTVLRWLFEINSQLFFFVLFVKSNHGSFERARWKFPKVSADSFYQNTLENLLRESMIQLRQSHFWIIFFFVSFLNVPRRWMNKNSPLTVTRQIFNIFFFFFFIKKIDNFYTRLCDLSNQGIK